MTTKNKRTLFISHGGGPLPLLGDKDHQEMVECLKDLATNHIEKPSCILLISAHWEETHPRTTASDQPNLIYDYYGFPEESYRIKYPCPGDPELASDINRTLEKVGFHADSTQTRGLDHGAFVPLKILFPNADIPCTQLSLMKNLDPGKHIKLGQALSRLTRPGLLVIGSGFSFHNLREFFKPESTESTKMNEAFHDWLVQTISNPSLDEDERERLLINWESAPYARFCHPREEHLLPLHVCYGMAGTHSLTSFQVKIMKKRSSMFLW